MRTHCALAAIVALVGALMLVPAAPASRPPIGSGLRAWLGLTRPPGLDRSRERGQASCSAHAKHSLGWVERKLLPVACEQPPRPNLLVTSAIASLIP